MESWTEEKKLWRRLAIRAVFFVAVLCGLLWLVPWLFEGFAPFFLATWVGMLLHPLISNLEEKINWKRCYIVLWLLFLCGMVVLSVAWLVVPAILGELLSLGENWEPLLEATVEMLRDGKEKLGVFQEEDGNSFLGDSLDAGMEELKVWVSSGVSRGLVALGDWVVKIPGYCLGFFVFLLATFFIALDFPKYEQQVKTHTSEECRWWVGELKHSAVVAFGGYLKAQLLLSLGVFVIMLLGFLCMDLPFALVIALVIALLDFIPMIGAGVVLLPWAGFGFFLGHQDMAWQLALIWLLTASFRRLLEPKVLGQQTGLSPLLSLIGIYVGLQVGGVWGMIFAPVLLLMVLHFLALGIFRGTMADLRLSLGQIEQLFQKER